jgi:hypothetical protein
MFHVHIGRDGYAVFTSNTLAMLLTAISDPHKALRHEKPLNAAIVARYSLN